MQLNKTKNVISSINIRISPELKNSLDHYCSTHIIKLSEAATSAIKAYIGFCQPSTVSTGKQIRLSSPKTLRLDLRVDSRIKAALEAHCKQSGETVTEAVIEAINLYTTTNQTN